MFNLNAKDGSVRKKQFKSPIKGGASDEGAAHVKGSELDSEKMVDLHHRLMDYRAKELDRQHENRAEMAQDEDFYDNIQWDAKDAATVEERGQKALVYNVISASVDWVLGTEKRSRSDHKILPRRKEDGKPAERKSQLLKYLSDVNRTPFHVSRAFADEVKVGIGWTEDYVDDEGEDEPIRTRYESWRRILWDSTSNELDLSDARYLFRDKWVDQDVALAIFPDRHGVLDRSALQALDIHTMGDDGDDAGDYAELELDHSAHIVDRVGFGYHRPRVRLIEGWVRIPVEVQKMKGGPFNREIYDKFSPGHREAVESGEAVLVKKMMMRMHVAIFTSIGMLWFSESPYRHNRFPFTPYWGKRRGRDNLPYGMIRGLKGMQEDINKRASKALWILSSNKVIMDEGAVDDIEEFRKEIARPDAVIVKIPGKDLKIDVDRELSQYQLEMMSRSIAMIQQSSGVTDELLGRETGAKSGIAIGRRQDQGSMATMHFFDNLRFASQISGENRLSLVEQFIDEPKAFRITNMRGAPEYIEVNNGLPENDIQRSKADFVITDADWKATQRQAQMDELMELVSKMPPAIGMVLLDLVVEQMDVSNRDELVKRIRAATGQRDPDAEELTEEEVAAQTAAAEQAALQQKAFELELQVKEADVGKKKAETKRIEAQTIEGKVNAQGKAMTVANDALTLAPAVAHTADMVMAEAGFKSNSDTKMEEAKAVGVAQAQAELQQQDQAEQAAMAEQEQAGASQPPMPQPAAPGTAPGVPEPA
jgi:hypothetical protein